MLEGNLGLDPPLSVVELVEVQTHLSVVRARLAAAAAEPKLWLWRRRTAPFVHLIGLDVLKVILRMNGLTSLDPLGPVTDRRPH